MNNTAKSRSLFHYTTSDGLLGILGSGALFASHYGFLNDKSEGNVLREVLLPFLMHEEGTDNHADGLLSQWRGYARGGFAIEFDELELDELTKRENAECRLQGILTNAVHYRDFDQFVKPDRFRGFAASLFKAVLDQVLPKAKRKLIEILGAKTTEDFARFYVGTVPFLKNSAFEEEHEYRIVALCNRIGVSDEADQRRYKNLHFRTRADGRITPFIKLFGDLATDLPIKSIVVGPHPHQESQLAAVRLVISEHGIDCDVRASRIPFRE